ncbi:MAG: hypothetical protein MPJ06_08055 [Nitrosopumilus sp.]|nr:hypothetical protein [Nitrosopumilus sp.]MDA7943933.1 hypothetical protein [Nitrosopumilus sp.]MDA7999079.1 hypothetical protein [Nitrosopumilus sp.]
MNTTTVALSALFLLVVTLLAQPGSGHAYPCVVNGASMSGQCSEIVIQTTECRDPYGCNSYKFLADPAPFQPATGAYQKNDILRAFDSMEEFITLDDRHHLVVDREAATRDPTLNKLDIEIAVNFAAHSDSIIDALRTGSVGNTGGPDTDNAELSAAMDDLENGKFRNLFTDDPGVASTMESPVLLTAGVNPDGRINGGWPGAVPIHHSAPGTACGGGFGDPHTKKLIEKKGDFDNKAAVILYLIQNNYHKVPAYATFHKIFGGNFGDDYAKLSSEYGCSRGEFRIQALAANEGSWFHYRMQGPEINPEVLSYVWPAYWWGAYVAHWHTYN